MNWRIIEQTMDYKKMEAYTMLPLAEIPDALGLTVETEHAYMAKHTPEALKYSGNGAWEMYLDDGFWCIHVNAGCHCEHDCCGHECSRFYFITPEPDGLHRIELRTAYNF